MTSLLKKDLSVTTSIGVGQNLFDAATGDGIVEIIVADQTRWNGSPLNFIKYGIC